MPKSDQTKSLDRWAGEGGAVLPAWAATYDGSGLSPRERLVLESLGAAVVAEWNALSTDVQRAIFRHAAANPSRAGDELKEHIARFLHVNKDKDATGETPGGG